MDNERITNLLTDEEKALLCAYRENRERMAADKYRPLYHFTCPGGDLNDPNGLCYYKGNWHLFYQYNTGSGYYWGHAISEDALNWVDLPPAFLPGENEKECWSGGVMVDHREDGDIAIAVYYSLNVGIILATSDDPLLNKWEKANGGEPVIPMPKNPEDAKRYAVFDPFIWKQGDNYYIITGKFIEDPETGKREREEFLFESKDLINWTFLHPFLERDRFTVHGDDGACPYFLPLKDKHVILHFSHMSGPKYILGRYDTEKNKFSVSDSKSLTTSTSFFGGLHAPSAFPEGEDSLRLIYNINYTKKTEHGLNQIMSLPMSVYYLDEDENELAFKPVAELADQRDGTPVYSHKEKLLSANEEYVFEGLSADSGELLIDLEAKNIPAIEIRLFRSDDAREYTSISIYRQRGNTYRKKFSYVNFSYRQCHETVMVLDTLHSTLDRSTTLRVPEMQEIFISPEEKLNLRIFTDKSVVEVYLNDKIVCASRVYPTLDSSTGVSITPIGDDITLDSLDFYKIKPIF